MAEGEENVEGKEVEINWDFTDTDNCSLCKEPILTSDTGELISNGNSYLTDSNGTITLYWNDQGSSGDVVFNCSYGDYNLNNSFNHLLETDIDGNSITGYCSGGNHSDQESCTSDETCGPYMDQPCNYLWDEMMLNNTFTVVDQKSKVDQKPATFVGG